MWFSCRHQFSWPRRSEDGGYYQICLQCGVKYSYDWGRMRRVARLQDESAAHGVKRTKCDSGAVWHPRERRLRVQTPVQYRLKGGTEWWEGHSENISRSGLLFHAFKTLELGTAVELVFEMPPEICGADARHTTVLCQAHIARVTFDGENSMLAAAIDGLEYLPAGKVAGL